MKRCYILAALFGAAFLLAGCTDEWGTNSQDYHKCAGDEIVFGASAKFEVNGKGSTRTIYNGLNADGTEEVVHWIANDYVRVYSPHTMNTSYADYKVTMEEGETGTSTFLSKASEEAKALQWGNSSVHDFYAVYPSPNQHPNDEAVVKSSDVLTQNTRFKGFLPNIQTPISIPGSTMTAGFNYNAQPNMNYAYMAAHTQVTSVDNVEGTFLYFKPLVTAVQITIANRTDQVPEGERPEYEGGQPLSLTSVLVSSVDKSPICGEFTAELSSMEINQTSNSSVAYSTKNPTVSYEGATNYQISVPMYSNGSHGSPTILQPGQSVTFTVFMLPTVDNLNSLNITVNGVEGVRNCTLSGMEIQSQKITFINNVPLTAALLPFTLESWLRFIEDNVIVRELSIPGTGGSATYALTDADLSTEAAKALGNINREMVVQQKKTIEQQWNTGIRCFEFAVDLNGNSETNSLGESKIICSGVQMNMTLAQAVSEVKKELIEHPYEFAMVIVTYETSGGWSGTRNPALFTSQLNNYWEKVEASEGDDSGWPTYEYLSGYKIETGTALYDPANATVGNSRGKLFCIARPTSAHLDYGTDVIDVSAYEGAKMVTGTPTTENQNAGRRRAFLPKDKIVADWQDMNLPSAHEDIMLIQGWGSLKDKWQQRGYTNYSVRGTNTSYAFNFSYDGFAYGSETTEEPGRPFDGAQFHEVNEGWSDTQTITPATGGYKITIAGVTSGSYSRLTITGVECSNANYTVTGSGTEYVIDLGNQKPTESFDVTIKYYGSYYRSSSTQHTDSEQTKTLTISNLAYENTKYTLTASATRSGRGNYTYSYDYDWDDPTNGDASSNGTTYYGTFPTKANFVINTSALTPDFYYDVQSGENIQKNGAWVQEWARVADTSGDYYWDNQLADCRNHYSNCDGGYYMSYWAPSYHEKIQRVKEALGYSVNKTKGAGTTYINSLCGYYITHDYPASSAPCSFTDCGHQPLTAGWYEVWVLSASSPISGMGGDISTFAKQINKDFYDYLMTQGDNGYVPGSMGIILMDRVGEADGASDVIPGIIVGNNFQFKQDQETNPVMQLIDTENEDPQYAPATRGADGEEEVMMVWE